ncbi:MAG: hypothetical protein WCB75_00930, partial [Pseudolabrys sp.]
DKQPLLTKGSSLDPLTSHTSGLDHLGGRYIKDVRNAMATLSPFPAIAIQIMIASVSTPPRAEK